MQQPLAHPEVLTPKHIRAARALLAWSQQELAKAAKVATSTVADFERGQRTPVANNAQAIRAALESAGVQFLPTGAIVGPDILRLPSAQGPALPMRWVTATDLAQWAERFDGIAGLPALLTMLIRAAHGAAVDLRFPSDEGVHHGGWDGLTEAPEAGAYIPAGPAGWEIGSQRTGIAAKASADYEKRTTAPAPLNPSESTFVFVTPRHWPQKAEWAQARRDEGRWRDVRAYDGADLVHWLELTPVVGQWLAARMDKRPQGARSLEELWTEWSMATELPLPVELVVSDRDDEAIGLLRWLRNDPSILSLQATTAEEVAAFYYATVKMLPEGVSDHYLVRSLAPVDAAAARAFLNAPAPLILVMLDPDPGLARNLVAHGHFVLLAYDGRPNAPGEVQTLPKPSREGIAAALIEAGVSEARARTLARDSGRNLSILRRLVPAAPGRLPAWAEASPPPALLAAVLAGGWNEANPGDQSEVAELTGGDYPAFVHALAPYLGEFDSPLRKVGDVWRVTSHLDAWLLLARFLTATDVQRFEQAADRVLGSVDPRYDLPSGERWLAAMNGVRPAYSEVLRHGIGETLILLALWGDQARMASGASRSADAIVRGLLGDADARRWWSLSRDLQLLAEASPKAFLDAIENSLDQAEPPILALFGADGDPVFGEEHLSDMLWALESLAWSPELLPRISVLLARLDDIDPGGRYSNRPDASLVQLYRLWAPQTHATLDQRLKALDLVRREVPAAAWKLMLGILPTGHDAYSPSLGARWRDFSTDRPERVTYGLIGRGAAAVRQRLLDDAGANPERWVALIDRLGDMPEDAGTVLDRLAAVEPTLGDAPSRKAVRDVLRRQLHRHREFVDATWSLPPEALDKVEAIYDRFAPADIVDQLAWLFDHAPALPRPDPEGWEAEQRQVETERRAAVAQVMKERGPDGILALARQVEAPGYVGKALIETDADRPIVDALLERAAMSADPGERGLAHGLVITTFQREGEAWAATVLERARAGAWGDEAVLTLLGGLPYRRWTWDQAAGFGPALHERYWKRAPVLWIDDQTADVVYAVENLIAAGRAHDAVHLAGRDKGRILPAALVIKALSEAVRQPLDEDRGPNDAVMFQYSVAGLLTRLDETPEVTGDDILRLEWAYLPLLEHSRRPARVLLQALADRPDLFVDMVAAVYRPSDDSGVEDPEPEDPERAKAMATQAYRLLRLWDRIPGADDDDGHIDPARLEDWIRAARAGAHKRGRGAIADIQIGTMLSASPKGADGVWPAEPVRAVMELFRSDGIEAGFRTGRYNRRGVTTRMPHDGGRLEHQEAAQFQRWADALTFDAPRTSRALQELAETYRHEARAMDERVVHQDWDR